MMASPEGADEIAADFSSGEGPLNRQMRLAGHGSFGSDLGHAMANVKPDAQTGTVDMGPQHGGKKS
jgi:hypothetical protein